MSLLSIKKSLGGTSASRVTKVIPRYCKICSYTLSIQLQFLQIPKGSERILLCCSAILLQSYSPGVKLIVKNYISSDELLSRRTMRSQVWIFIQPYLIQSMKYPCIGHPSTLRPESNNLVSLITLFAEIWTA